jgi:hypothetical protein
MKGFLILTMLLFLMGNTKAQTSNEVKSFTIKNIKELPNWFDQVERTYMLNDDRILEIELIQFVGGYVANRGEIFFINNTEIIFPENQIKIDKTKTFITKTLTSGQYTIKIICDTDLNTGAYNEGTINLYFNNTSVFKSPLIISGL